MKHEKFGQKPYTTIKLMLLVRFIHISTGILNMKLCVLFTTQLYKMKRAISFLDH